MIENQASKPTESQARCWLYNKLQTMDPKWVRHVNEIMDYLRHGTSDASEIEEELKHPTNQRIVNKSK